MRLSQIVWVVEWQDGVEDSAVIGVFSTEALAKGFIAQRGRDSIWYSASAYRLDQPSLLDENGVDKE